MRRMVDRGLPGQQDYLVVADRPAGAAVTAGGPGGRGGGPALAVPDNRGVDPCLAHGTRPRCEPPQLLLNLAQDIPAQGVEVVAAFLADRDEPGLLKDLRVV